MGIDEKLYLTLREHGFSDQEIAEEGFLEHDFITMQAMIDFWDDDDA